MKTGVLSAQNEITCFAANISETLCLRYKQHSSFYTETSTVVQY
jgi:hypothetical protein